MLPSGSIQHSVSADGMRQNLVRKRCALVELGELVVILLFAEYLLLHLALDLVQ